MNEANEQARERDTKVNVALYNAATNYAEYVMSDRSNYDEAMKLAGALEDAAVAYAKIAGVRQPEAVQNAGNIAGSVSANGSAHRPIPFETVAKALGIKLPTEPPKPVCVCHSTRDRIRCWKGDADDAVAGMYGNNPQGQCIDYWRGRQSVLYELDALHDYPINALEHENAALKDALTALKDFVEGKRTDSENIAAILNGALKADAPNR